MDPLISAEQVSFDSWANLGAVGIMAGLLWWVITKGIPKLQSGFVAELKAQRETFRDELAKEREQSRDLATSGHNAVNNLSESVRDLSNEIKSLLREARPDK